MKKSFECCILGSGPAGISAAYELTKKGIRDILIIDKNEKVGGLARTEIFNNSRFDVGPHRFFTKNHEVKSLWKNTLKNDFFPVSRKTRILYNNSFFDYPIRPLNVFKTIGISETNRILLSYLSSREILNKKRDINTFEDWIVDKFGEKLYTMFFKTYTEKVWGIPCNQINKEFAAQRIKGLNVFEILKQMLFKKNTPKTLVEEFDYPKFGAGQMYEALLEKIVDLGGRIKFNTNIDLIKIENNSIKYIAYSEGKNKHKITANAFFSSIPITNFFKFLSPLPTNEVKKASEALYYREHITVNIIINSENLFLDQWIYVHDPKVRVARIANYNNFSNYMSSSLKQSCLSVEYFSFQNEDLWKMSDEELIILAFDELVELKICNINSFNSAYVVRESESYPTYYLGYEEPYLKLKKFLKKIKNIYPIGRGGMYKYNNMDHSILSGMLAARNYLNKNNYYDVWSINTDAEYQEDFKR